MLITTKNQTKTKPKCGKGQSCGNSCISAKDTCKEKLDAATASKLIAVTQQLSSIRDKAVKSFAPGDTGKTFEELEAKYQFTNATRGTSVEEKLDKGISLWHITMPASDASGDTLSYSVLNAGGKSYTVSDGLIKEYTASDRNGLYKESIQAAIRAKVEQDSLAQSASGEKLKPKDNTKLMKLDYLNSPITDSHILEFNKVTGMSASKAEIESIVWSAVMYSNGGKWNNQDSVNSEQAPGSLAKYLEAPGTKYTGDVYRGETYSTENEAVAAISRYSEGLPYLQSWSKSEDVAKAFGSSTEKPYSVMYKDSSGSMTDIEKFTQAYSNEFVEGWDKSEQEVVSGPGYKATRKPKVTRNGNTFNVEA